MADMNNMAGSTNTGFNIGANDATLQYTRDMTQSTETLTEHVEKIGASFGKSEEYIKNINVIQTQMVSSILTYINAVTQLQNNYKAIEESNSRILSTQKEVTAETEKQYGHIIASGWGKNTPGMWERGTNVAATASNFVEDPVSQMKKVGTALEESAPKWVKFAATVVSLGIVIAKASESLIRYNELASRPAGLSPLEAMGSMKNIAWLDVMSQANSARQFATPQETMGAAGTLVGMGGLRGDDLLKTMSGLAESTHSLGLGFVATAADIAHLSRITDSSGEVAKNALLGVATEAVAQKWPVQEYTNAVMDLTLRTYKFGGSLTESNEIVKNNYKLVMNGTMSTGEFINSIESAADMIKEHGGSTADAYDLSGRLLANFGDDIGKLHIKWPDLLSITDSMTHQFGTTDTEAMALAKYLMDAGQAAHISTADMKSWHESMAKGTVTLFDSPKEAAYSAAIATKLFAKDLETGTITTGDYTTMMKLHKDAFNDSSVDAVSKFKIMANIVDTTNIRMEELTAYMSQSAKLFRQYGIDEMGIGLDSFKRYNQFVREGSLSIQDFQAVLKGSGGSSDAMQAMMFDKLVAQGGTAGAAFNKAGLLGSIDVLLPALQKVTAKGGEKAADYQENMGILSRAGLGSVNLKDLQKNISQIYRENVQGVIGMGANEFEQAAIFKKMSPDLVGSQISARDAALMDLVTHTVTGKISDSVKEVAKGTTSDSDLKSSYTQFGVSVIDFTKAVGAFSKKAYGESTSNTGVIEMPTAQTTPAVVKPSAMQSLSGMHGGLSVADFSFGGTGSDNTHITPKALPRQGATQ